MKNNKNIISKVFDMLAKEIEKFSETELIDISSGKAKLKIEIVKYKSTTSDPTRSEINMSELKSALDSLQSREEVLQYLNEHCKTKKELTLIAKAVDVHVQKSDKVDQLKEKIIESTIGFKLRSAAIQNKSIKGEQS
jgi:hypothetical protein